MLSESTEAYDRGDKFEHYRKIDSLVEYILISQNKPHVERFVRQQENNWLLTENSDLASFIELSAINCTLELVEIYDKVELS